VADFALGCNFPVEGFELQNPERAELRETGQVREKRDEVDNFDKSLARRWGTCGIALGVLTHEAMM